MSRKHKISGRNGFSWNDFVNQPDPKVETNLADSTKANLKHIEYNFSKYVNLLSTELLVITFSRFVQELQPKNSEYWLENISLRVIEGFFRWYLDNHNVKYQSAFLVFARYWRMYWCEKMDKQFPYDLRRKMVKVSIPSERSHCYKLT